MDRVRESVFSQIYTKIITHLLVCIAKPPVKPVRTMLLFASLVKLLTFLTLALVHRCVLTPEGMATHLTEYVKIATRLAEPAQDLQTALHAEILHFIWTGMVPV